MSIMPILILAVTDASVGAAIFFTDEFSQNMISEGNKVADTLGAEFKMTTANFQQQGKSDMKVICMYVYYCVFYIL